MDNDHSAMRRVFAHIHQQMPRQGPGSSTSTQRALALLPDRDSIRTVLDLGCGPGAQTLVLAQHLPGAKLRALDLSSILLAEAQATIDAAGFGDRVSFETGDMSAISARDIDLIWCEGAAYNIGVANALQQWRPLLKPGGCIAYTDAVWLQQDPPAAISEFWQEYPAMADCAYHRELATKSGFTLLGDFVQPASDWQEYYGPLQARVTELREHYADDPGAQKVLDASQLEIDLYAQYHDSYSYAFFVLQKN